MNKLRLRRLLKTFKKLKTKTKVCGIGSTIKENIFDKEIQNQKGAKMREIDFRAFSKSRQRMFSCLHLKKATRGMVITANKQLKELGYKTDQLVPNGLFLPLKDDDLIFMQYTGIKDKNGKKIYEGDIIKTKEGILQVVEYHNIPQNEISQNACFGCKTEDEEGIMYFNIDFDDEVIGNIYENPQLLEGN